MTKGAIKSKLKRDRKSLKTPAKKSGVENRKVSGSDPAHRRFIPIKPQNLDASGVLDWRENRPGKIRDINDITNRIICADSETALKLLPDNSVDCVITSPPYWNVIDYGAENQLGACEYETYLNQLLGVWRECERILAPNGKLCVNTPIMPISKKIIPNQHTRHLKNLNNDVERTILQNLKLNRYSLYIWQKQTTEKMFGSYPYPPNLYEQNTVEFINVFVKDGKPKQLPKEVKERSRLTDKEWMNLTRQIWQLYPEDVKRVHHPAPFPESLPNRLIAMYSFAAAPDFEPPFLGDIVLDPFNGAGATCAAAKKLNRRYIGIDLSPDFCVSAEKRLMNCVADKKTFMVSEKNR